MQGRFEMRLLKAIAPFLLVLGKHWRLEWLLLLLLLLLFYSCYCRHREDFSNKE
jgi:hypothetical protein